MMRFAAILALALALPAAAAPDWQEATLAGGGRVLAVGGGAGDYTALLLAFPAGLSQAGDDTRAARLAPALFAGPGWEFGLSSDLRRLGWEMRHRVDADLALITLDGPSAGLDTVMDYLLGRLKHPEFDGDLFEAACAELRRDEEKWSANAEVALRQELAELHYGDHPYARASRRLETGPWPGAAEAQGFLDERYGSGGLFLLAAGDLSAGGFLERWLPELDRLTGNAPALAELPPLEPGAGRLERPGEERRELLILQFPGEEPGSAAAVQQALAAGVLHQLLQRDLRGRGMAMSASAWLDFSARGPRPLEVQVRGFAPENRQLIEDTVEELLRRLREGEFSQFQVITAKDVILQRMDKHSRRGEGPPRSGAAGLRAWCEELARQSLHGRERGERFRQGVMEGSLESISAYARERLLMERGTTGLLLPGAALD